MRIFFTIPLLLLTMLGSAQFAFDARIVDYVGLKFPCEGVVRPVLAIRNEGTTPMSGCVVETWKNGILVNTFDWQLAVPSVEGELRKPAFPEVTDVVPTDELEFRIKTVNAVPDQNADGNIKLIEVDAVHASTPSTEITVKVVTDDAPQDLTWEIRNDLDQLVASGGPYADANTVITDPVVLDAGVCYNVKAVDGGRDVVSGARVQVVSGQNTLLSFEGAQLMDGTRQGLSTGSGAGCTEQLIIELHTDDAPDQTSWEILGQEDGAIVCAGAGDYPAGSILTEACCLEVGCYRMRVLDAGGDGITSGGYVLRTSDTMARIIDDRDNFNTGASSALSGGQGFCLPIGGDRTIFSSCDKLDWVTNKFIVASENASVSAQLGITNSTSGYVFWFFDPNGSFSYRRFRSHATSDGYGAGATRACHFRVNGWLNTPTTPHLPPNILLNVRVRGRVAGVNQEFGPACQFRIDPVLAACPRVKLQDNPLSNYYSCGVNKVFGGSNSAANRITSTRPQPIPAVSSADVRYQFRFRIPGEVPNEGSCIVRPVQTSATLYLNWSGSDRLKCNTQYEVDVRTSLDGGTTWCFGGTDPVCDPSPTPWGTVCQLNITSSTYCPSAVAVEGSSMALSSDANLTLFPNPTSGDALKLSLTGLDASLTSVSFTMFDLTGKQVAMRNIPIADGRVLVNIDEAASLASGVYLVHVQAGSSSFVERLVVRKD